MATFSLANRRGSDSEVGLALGLGGDALPDPLRALIPLLVPEGVAMLGPRDRKEIDDAGASSLDKTVALFLDDAAVRAYGAPASIYQAVAAFRLAVPAFWLHPDLDVLRTEELAAVDYPQSGGLTWLELSDICSLAVTTRGCAGVSIVIYNPDKDQDGAAAERILSFAADLVATTSENSF